jgi:ABC-2 type transport system permease protein
MRGSLKVISGFFKKEFAQVLRDPVMRIFLFVAPLIQLTLFGYAISTEFKNLKLAFMYEPADVAARELSGHFYTSRWFIPVDLKGLSPEELLQSGKADAVLITQSGGLTKALGRNNASLQLLIDATNTTKARSAENYVKLIVQKFSQNLAGGLANFQAPITFDIRILYNPTMETSYFMIPGIMTMIICIVTIMLTSMSLAREKELGTLETIIAAPLKNTEIILGKTVPFIVMGIGDALIVMSGALIIFGVPLRGSLFLMLLAMIIFVCTTVSIGMLISTFAANQQQAMMGSFLFILPANLLSGVFFPVENMPEALKIAAYVDPLMYLVRILRNIMLKGANPEIVFTYTSLLAVMCAFSVSIAVLRFRQRLN